MVSAVPETPIWKASGVVEETARAVQHVAGQRAQAPVEDADQLVGVGVEQHAALLQLDAGEVEQRVETYSRKIGTHGVSPKVRQLA